MTTFLSLVLGFAAGATVALLFSAQYRRFVLTLAVLALGVYVGARFFGRPADSERGAAAGGTIAEDIKRGLKAPIDKAQQSVDALEKRIKDNERLADELLEK
jgi:hypothetical protein